MSTCISREGEYSDHEPGDWCPRCGAFNEEAIVAERDRLREVVAALSVPPTSDDREALEAIWDDGNAVGLDGWVGPGRGTEPVDEYAIQARARAVEKHAAGFRRQGPPSDDDRETLTERFANLIFEHGLRSPESTKAVIAFKEVTAGFRRQGPITDEAVAAATIAALDAVQPTWRATGEAPSADDLAFARAALEAAERARSAVPSTTEQESE